MMYLYIDVAIDLGFNVITMFIIILTIAIVLVIVEITAVYVNRKFVNNEIN